MMAVEMNKPTLIELFSPFVPSNVRVISIKVLHLILKLRSQIPQRYDVILKSGSTDDDDVQTTMRRCKIYDKCAKVELAVAGIGQCLEAVASTGCQVGEVRFILGSTIYHPLETVSLQFPCGDTSGSGSAQPACPLSIIQVVQTLLETMGDRVRNLPLTNCHLMLNLKLPAAAATASDNLRAVLQRSQLARKHGYKPSAGGRGRHWIYKLRYSGRVSLAAVGGCGELAAEPVDSESIRESTESSLKTCKAPIQSLPSPQHSHLPGDKLTSVLLPGDKLTSVLGRCSAESRHDTESVRYRGGHYSDIQRREEQIALLMQHHNNQPTSAGDDMITEAESTRSNEEYCWYQCPIVVKGFRDAFKHDPK